MSGVVCSDSARCLVENNIFNNEMPVTLYRWYNEDGSPRTELFVEDGLHFNAQGYEEWSSVIRPVIYKKLAHDKKAEKKSAKKQSVEKPYETEPLKGNKLTK